MKTLDIKLENCYGITKFNYKFNFKDKNAFLIYASNGLMKTSFTKTFDAVINGKQPEEEIFGLTSSYSIKDEYDEVINAENTIVVKSYDESYSSKNVSALLMDDKLKKEYDKITKAIIDAKDEFIKTIDIDFPKGINFESEFNRIFRTKSMFEGLEKILNDGIGQPLQIDFSKINYGDLFNDKVKDFVDKNIKALIEYKNEYQTLVNNCKYYSQGVFSQYNADNIGISLKDNGFFEAGHKVVLNDDKKLSSVEEFMELFKQEKAKIFSDKKLEKKFAKIDKALSKNSQLRNFRKIIETNLEIITIITPFDLFEKNCWYGIIKNNIKNIKKLIDEYQNSKIEIQRIQKLAKKQNENWENVIKIFTERFHVPFNVTIGNQEDVILRNSLPVFEFTYKNKSNTSSTKVERSKLNSILSTGERRALYLMNIIFELEALKKQSKEYLIICDDIAESFDYKNKHAIVEYLYENYKCGVFKFIILTHNFDFYRTISSRLLSYDRKHSLMARFNYDDNTICLDDGKYQKNIFEYWHKNIDGNKSIVLATIPFIRNIIEYTRSTSDPDYEELTSLLHYKKYAKIPTNKITIYELNRIIQTVWSDVNLIKTYNLSDCVYEKIIDEAKRISNMPDNGSLDLEEKIVLSMACRLLGEKFMIDALLENGLTPEHISSITKNQTAELAKMYENKFGVNNKAFIILRQILLFTSENIHLNSFMYEPLIDTSPSELKTLCNTLLNFKNLKIDT